jgi:hypothetical protein
MRTLIVPLLGMDRGQAFGALMLRSGGIGTPIGVGLLVLAGLLVAWLARGLRPGDRGMLAGAYVLVTTVTFLTAVGDKAMLLHTPWTSSRYAFTPGVLVLVMVLGCVRRGAGALRAALCALLLGFAMVRGVMQYPGGVRWKPTWPVWSDQVRAWEVNPQRPLEIWPPPWALSLPAPSSVAGAAAPDGATPSCPARDVRATTASDGSLHESRRLHERDIPRGARRGQRPGRRALSRLPRAGVLLAPPDSCARRRRLPRPGARPARLR